MPSRPWQKLPTQQTSFERIRSSSPSFPLFNRSAVCQKKHSLAPHHPAKGVVSLLRCDSFPLTRPSWWSDESEASSPTAYSLSSSNSPNRSILRSHSVRCSPTHRSSASNPVEAIRHVRTRPTFSVVTSPHSSSISRCCHTAVSVIPSGPASCDTDTGPRLNRSSIARRVRSPSA